MPPRLRSLAARLFSRTAFRRAEVVFVALLGAVLGVLLLGGTNARIGPVHAHLELRLTLSGGTEVDIPPLGTLHLDTHAGPAQLTMRVTEIDAATAQNLFKDPASADQLGARVDHDAKVAVTKLLIRSSVAAIVGGALLTTLVVRRRKAAAIGGGIGLVTMVLTAGLAVASWNPGSLVEPRYTGLLARAPAVVGDVQNIVNRFGQYSTELARLVTNVTKLYGVTSTLPSYSPDPTTIRVLHVSDIHLNPVAWSVIGSISREFDINAIVDTGDLTDHGTTAEDSFTNDISSLGRPYIFIKGNHDSSSTVAAVKRQPNAHVLDNSEVTIAGLTFYGAGDPRFTPDRSTSLGDENEIMQAFGDAMAANIRLASPQPDVALVHDPVAGERLAGTVPLVLAGHTHKRDVVQLADGTTMMVEGSTGGAGLRALEGAKPTNVECSILYFDRQTHKLQAYDNITIGGLGLASATIDRHLAEKPSTSTAGSPSESPSASPSQTPSTTPSATTSSTSPRRAQPRSEAALTPRRSAGRRRRRARSGTAL